MQNKKLIFTTEGTEKDKNKKIKEKGRRGRDGEKLK